MMMGLWPGGPRLGLKIGKKHGRALCLAVGWALWREAERRTTDRRGEFWWRITG